MRIDPETLRIIKELACKYFGEDAEIRIFGSRLDDTKRGGDIDIYIETSLETGFEEKAGFLKDLKIAIGDQKIDLLVKKRGESPKGVFEYAKTTGVKI